VNIKQVTTYAPASIANLGPGFDVFGIALEDLGDTITLVVVPEKGVRVSIVGVDADSIPVNAVENSAGAVLNHFIEKHHPDHGFRVNIEKGVPPGKGMGSSGASAAAVTHAICILEELTLSQKERIRLAAMGEAAITGSPHADNVSPSLLGGFCIIGPDYEVTRLDPPDVEIVVVTPEVHYENKTRLARSLLPEKVGLKEAVFNIGNSARMTAAVAIGDPVLFGRSIRDKMIEPYRAKMIPNFWGVKKAALDAGAYGCSIAGGGPSLFAVGPNPGDIGKSMVEAFDKTGVRSTMMLTRPNMTGVRVI
jgi:homoserine kinase